MSTATAPSLRQLPTDAFGAPALEVRAFTVDEYHDLIRRGFFKQSERLELLDGFIVSKMPHDPLHDAAVHQDRKVLERHLPSGWHIRVQSSVTLSDSEPEPDLAIVRGDELDFARNHPGSKDIALLIEVANTSLQRDRALKAAIYARESVREYWIINLTDWRVEVYSDPSGPDPAPTYRRREEFGPGSILSRSTGELALTVSVDDLLPEKLRS